MKIYKNQRVVYFRKNCDYPNSLYVDTHDENDNRLAWICSMNEQSHLQNLKNKGCKCTIIIDSLDTSLTGLHFIKIIEEIQPMFELAEDVGLSVLS